MYNYWLRFDGDDFILKQDATRPFFSLEILIFLNKKVIKIFSEKSLSIRKVFRINLKNKSQLTAVDVSNSFLTSRIGTRCHPSLLKLILVFSLHEFYD